MYLHGEPAYAAIDATCALISDEPRLRTNPDFGRSHTQQSQILKFGRVFQARDEHVCAAGIMPPHAEQPMLGTPAIHFPRDMAVRQSRKKSTKANLVRSDTNFEFKFQRPQRTYHCGETLVLRVLLSVASRRVRGGGVGGHLESAPSLD